jgi:hypothetical protein
MLMRKTKPKVFPALAVLTGYADPSPQSPGPVPSVTGSFGGNPVITIPGGNPPSQLVVTTLSPENQPLARHSAASYVSSAKSLKAGKEFSYAHRDMQP